ncbi:MAG: hypothetical protein ACXVH9_05245 [Halobacteriota archaeon]
MYVNSYEPLSDPLCTLCKHFRATHFPQATCDAYPNGIPSALLPWEHDHRAPFPGDNGILFEPQEEAARFVYRYIGHLPLR